MAASAVAAPEAAPTVAKSAATAAKAATVSPAAEAAIAATEISATISPVISAAVISAEIVGRVEWAAIIIGVGVIPAIISTVELDSLHRGAQRGVADSFSGVCRRGRHHDANRNSKGSCLCLQHYVQAMNS
jgi:hypothetical protein